ncbi:MAG: thioesterase family protein [Flavihumibacter sp.]|nr:thioesterase family protein [Flavihumibacter sp.]
MSRVKLTMPDRFSFSTQIPVRITDINYGGHVGNDAILSLIHEARLQYLQHLGYTELNLQGFGLLMVDAAIEFKHELFYGNSLTIAVTAADISRSSFNLYYKMETVKEDKSVVVALVKTGMICYDYAAKKVASIPNDVRKSLEA